MKLRYLFILTAILLLFIASCEEQGEETDYNPNVKSSKDYIFAEDVFFEIVNIFIEGITDSAVLHEDYAYLYNCGIINKPLENSMTFEYGGVNRWCPDNKYRRGRFHAIFSGPTFTEASSVTFTFDSLFVDNDLVEATMSSEFLGTDNSGRQQITFRIQDGRITLNDTANGSVHHFAAEYLFTWEDGQETPYFHEDDMFLVTGNTSGKSLDQVDFQLVIQEPLQDYLACYWIASGTHRITIPEAEIKEGTIDYITTDDCFYRVNFFFGESEFYEYLKY